MTVKAPLLHKQVRLNATPPEGIVFDIRKYSIHDGPGIRTTVFLKGCPLSCWWCHNPEGQSPEIEIILRGNRCIRCGTCVDSCKSGAIYQKGTDFLLNRSRCTLCGSCVEECYAEALELIGKKMSVAEVLQVILSDLPFYEQSNGGVTFSGGEPLMQPRFLHALLLECQKQGIHSAVDTCGYANWNVIAQIKDEVDLFLYDIKVFDDALHRKYTGVSNQLILNNLRRLAENGSNIIIRYPVIPGINDSQEQVRQLAVWVKSLPNLEEIDILPYHASAINKYNSLGKDYTLGELNSPEDEQLQDIANIIQEYGLIVKIGG